MASKSSNDSETINKNDKNDKKTNTNKAEEEEEEDAALLMKIRKKKQEEMEARAVDRAKMNADIAYRPAPSILNAQSAQVLLQQVDGPSLQTYDELESIYVGRSVPVLAGSKINIPINVATPGSVVSYAIELKSYDIDFSITAEREEGITIVKEKSRIQATTDSGPITQKFLVGTVPCMLQFDFMNEYSWYREKIISYKITVTPPTKESLAAGRRRRAQACLKAVDDDLHTAVTRLQTTQQQQQSIQENITKYTKLLEEAKKAYDVTTKEMTWLQQRQSLRQEQQKLLQQRLQHGWPDEVAIQQQQQQQQNGKK